VESKLEEENPHRRFVRQATTKKVTTVKATTTTKKGTTLKATTKPTSKGTTKATLKPAGTTKKATTYSNVGYILYDKDFPNGLLVQGGTSKILPKTTKATNIDLRSLDRSAPLEAMAIIDSPYYDFLSTSTTMSSTTSEYQEDDYPFFTRFRPRFFNPFLFRQRYVSRSSWWSRMRYGHFSRGQK
jgi:hypothetical protein